MLIAALILAGFASLVHIYIWWIESHGFMTVGRQVFGIAADDAAIIRLWALNQGYYNLFLAIGTATGITLIHPNRDAGVAIVTFCTAFMVAAALVLAGSDTSKARGAVVQGLFPALALLCLVIWAL